MDKIDLVVPYVDAADKNWQALFEQYTPRKNVEGVDALNRFRGQGDFFKYFFRCVAQNMPWINNVFLLVQSDSQVPEWLNQDRVKVIKHEEFIPKEYLPTFNSTAIEMFIWNIPGLSEQFLYTNDDIYPVGPLKPEHFFGEGKCKTNGRFCGGLNTMYGHHIVNSYELIYEKKNPLGNMCVGFSHLIRPLLKSKCKECFDRYKDKILPSISRFREEKNFNVYIYDNYIIRNTQTLPRIGILPQFVNSLVSEGQLESILSTIGKKYNMINLCDSSDQVDLYRSKILNKVFSEKYSGKSKYEK